MDYTSITLGTLLSFKDETIRRNAMSILKRLPDALALEINSLPWNPAFEAAVRGKRYARASEARATDEDREQAKTYVCNLDHIHENSANCRLLD